MSARVVHFELPVDDPDRASDFYQKVFGWHIEKWDGPQDYWLITTGQDGETGINGALTRRSEAFAHTVSTVGVDSLDEALARAEACGATVLMKDVVPGIGWLAYCLDTEGNQFGMIQNDPTAGQG
jgi:predicted enzyme related to lactoylglutathione lyase